MTFPISMTAIPATLTSKPNRYIRPGSTPRAVSG
jgi:hypothetical protein